MTENPTGNGLSKTCNSLVHTAERSTEPSWTQGLGCVVSSGIILHVPRPCPSAVFSGQFTPHGDKKAASIIRLASHTTKPSGKDNSPPLQACHTPSPRQKQSLSGTLGFKPCLSLAFLATVSPAHLFLAYLWPEVQENVYAELSFTRVE